jgi:NADH-quinone oxidoreductase subunit L
MPHQLVWLIFLLPILSFIIISFVIRPFFRQQPKLSGYVTIGSLGLSLLLSLRALGEVMAAPGHRLEIPDVSWVVIEPDLHIHLGILMDSLTAVMLVVVTSVSLMVQIYSQGYMHGDAGYHRYFAWMSLFTASMLGLVLADNLLFLFVFWEGVGLCSYLLIGFWFHRPAAADAAKKAFIVTRLGDFGFLAAILFLFFKTGTFDIAELHALAIAGTLAGTALTVAAIGIFAGAAGKSAQFPLHVWLPDAMEGPTPVSSLIHAATMVAAGVFLVARTFPLFAHSEQALQLIAGIGAFTAIFAASMGLVMNDIKRVLAYSTISQLGYMMLALGAGGLAAYAGGHPGGTEEAIALGISVGMFHLFNHAYFKCLLFLGAGSVNHATGTFDMRLMGGLRKYMPYTFITFLIGSLSLAGIWPLAGFWSKDEILVVSFSSAPVWFYLALITVFMTAFYMFRVVFMTFGGDYRGGDPAALHGAHDSGPGGQPPLPHESPRVMVLPMVVLAIFSVASGWLNLTGGFSSFLGHGEGGHSWLVGLFGIFTHPLPWISLIVALLGIGLAYAMYSARRLSAESVGRVFSPLYTMLSRKYWFDELYERVIVVRVLLNGIFQGFQLFDTHSVDGSVNGIAQGTIAAGSGLRRAQTGQLQLYGLVIGLGLLAIIIALFLWG